MQRFRDLELPTGDTIESFWWKAVIWASRHDHFMIFRNNGIRYPQGPFRNLIMAGSRRKISFREGRFFEDLKNDRTANKGWLCGFLGYDLKNEVEKLQSRHLNYTGFEDGCFFEPETILVFQNNRIEISTTDHTNADDVIAEINSAEYPKSIPSPAHLIRKTPKYDYIQTVEKIREHILNGDIYEMNYCMEFCLEHVMVDPLILWKSLTEHSPTPFSVFGGFNGHFLISASPERFLRKTGRTLLSQPIKGTARRGHSPEEDEQIKNILFNSEKERAENMMIVDLVRNDLTRCAETGSIKVPELFGIYTFRHLHQMISSVTATLRPDAHPVDAIRYAFPMGSMTGAPKVKVMQLIEQYENGRRSIYSGAAGYFDDSDDFDFNVVIRSMSFHPKSGRLNFWVGSAITFDSDAEEEYSECMLKAQAILEVLQSLGILDGEKIK